LREQLAAGVRAFDIRCRHLHNGLFIYHGPVYQRISFNEVLRQLRGFLRDNPTEIVLLRIKEEYRPERNTRSFLDTLRQYLPDAKKTSTKEIGSLRGEMIVLSDFRPDHVYDIPWREADIQDDYRVPTVFSIRDKWTKVREQFEASRSSKDDTLFINFLSGTSA